MIRLAAPSGQYDARDEAEARRSIEQAVTDLAASMPANTGAPAVSGSGTTGKIPIWTTSGALSDSTMTEAAGVVNFPSRPTFGGNGLALLSESISQAAADARYKPIGYFPTWAQVSGTPTTIGGYGITDLNSLGDARWLGIAATAAAATKLITPRAIAGVNFDGTAAIAIPFANLSGTPTTIGGYGITDFNSLGDARWLKIDGSTAMTGALIFSANGYRLASSGFGSFLAGGLAYFGDGATGRGLSINLSTFVTNFSDALTGTGATFSGGVGADSFQVGGVTFAYYTSSYNLLYRRDGVIGIFLGGADPSNYYDNTGHSFRNRAGTVMASFDAVTAHFYANANVDRNLYFVGNYGYGLVGLYDPTKYRQIYAMGDAYKMDGTGNNLTGLYGLFFAFDATSGYQNVSGYGLGHGFGLAQNGTPMAYIGAGGMWLAGFMVTSSIVVTAGDVVLNTAGKTFKDSFGNPMAPIIVSASAPSGTAADRTLWIQV